eukprot:scaffold7513_cov49-Phaeocystis_antarctica.AAC.2
MRAAAPRYATQGSNTGLADPRSATHTFEPRLGQAIRGGARARRLRHRPRLRLRRHAARQPSLAHARTLRYAISRHLSRAARGWRAAARRRQHARRQRRRR